MTTVVSGWTVEWRERRQQGGVKIRGGDYERQWWVGDSCGNGMNRRGVKIQFTRRPWGSKPPQKIHREWLREFVNKIATHRKLFVVVIMKNRQKTLTGQGCKGCGLLRSLPARAVDAVGVAEYAEYVS
jgi:hypothetical protein